MAQYSHLSSVVSSLAKVPTELAHQVIDDLRVKDILKLLCYEDDRVDACIAMFELGDPNNMAKIKFAARFYTNFFREVNPSLASEGWVTTRVRTKFLLQNIHWVEPKDYKKITLEMREQIHFELCQHWAKTDLTQLGVPEYPARENYPFCLPPDHSSFEDLKERWEAIKVAKAILFKQRSSELSYAADILEANPDILKRTLDPHQARRPNTAHLVSRLRYTADKILRAPGQRFVASEHFSYEFFPVTPFDSVLAELLHMMEKHGIVAGGKLIEYSAIDSGLAGSQSYSIRESVRILLDGMSHFELSALITPRKRTAMIHSSITNAEGLVPRTGNTPWSEERKLIDGVGIEGPYFTPNKIGKSGAFRRPEICQWDPHGEREKDWLGAFVKVYRYLTNLEKLS